MRELAALLDHLGISERYHVLGQSWGGMLGMEHAVTQPPGLRSLVIANSPASIELWVSETGRLRSLLPIDVQQALTAHETAGTTDSEEYQQAMMVFYERHLCRIVPFPERAPAHVRSAGRGPDRVPDDERAERVPRRRVAARVGHHAAAAPRSASPRW